MNRTPYIQLNNPGSPIPDEVKLTSSFPNGPHPARGHWQVSPPARGEYKLWLLLSATGEVVNRPQMVRNLGTIYAEGRGLAYPHTF